MEFAELILTPTLDGVVMHGPFHKPVDGTLCITGHHLILSSRKQGVEELWLLHQNVDAVERRPNGLLGGSLVVRCKDLRVIQLDIGTTEEFGNVATSIEQLSAVGLEHPTYLYPFFYRPMYPTLEDGWSAFRPETEFGKLVQGDDWRITYINSDFQVCPTYPSVLVVPKSIDDETIIAASRFREGGRFPILSYRHEAGSILMRSSQPLTGPAWRRCKEDERLINCVLGPGKRGYIVDTRSQAVAHAARSRGGGFELEVHYPQWRRVNKPIERHHLLLDSLTKLVEACNDTSSTMDRWLSRLESSNWIAHIKDTLNCACLVAQCIDQEGASVLVHGSEGLDATLLVTSLAQIILNPDCRTVRGLEALIEREWLQAGHPFATRHAHSCYSPPHVRSKANAPTFLLFLDCLGQIHSQFPCSFEFTLGLLVQLFEHSYSSQFGTLLGDSEAERARLGLGAKTASLWSYLNRPDVLHSILNTLYEPNSKVIWPSVAPMSLNLWSELFLRWVIDPGEVRDAARAVSALKERDKELRGKAARLRRQLAELEREAAALGIAELSN